MRWLASGRDADVFDIGGGRVLRRYRVAGAAAEDEAAVMGHVSAAGYPAPVVHDVSGPDLVMDRATGPTMGEAIERRLLAPEEAGATLARLLHDLHQIALPAELAAVDRPVGLAGDERACIAHLDLHPHNVIMTPSGPIVIDWRNVRAAPADLDNAVSALIVAEVAIDQPAALALLNAVRARLRSVDARYLLAARSYRSADPNLSTTERSRIMAAVDLI